MDIGRAFGFVFEDEEWITKILLGGLISLIPIIGNIMVLGYMLDTARNVARGMEKPLPAWNDFGGILTRGFYALIIALVYQIPLIILVCIVQFLPIVLAGVAGDSGAAIGGILVLCLSLLMIVVGIAFALMIYAAFAIYIQTDSLGEAFNFGRAWSLVQNNLGAWGMLILLAIIAGLVGSLGLIACGIGVLFTLVYAYAVIGHGLGQTIRQLGMGGSPAGPVTPGAPTFG